MIPKRPLRVIDVVWPMHPLEEHTAMIWGGRLWRVVPAGCVLCVEDHPTSTISTEDDAGSSTFWCIEHEWLVEIPVVIVRHYEIQIGDVARECETVTNDALLVPASLPPKERQQLIERIMDEEADDEAADDE